MTESIALEGALTVDEVPSTLTNSQAWLQSELPSRVDLADVTKADSSAVALLLEWQAWAKRRGTSIEFANPPESLRTIAGLSQVESLLGWSETV